MSEKPTSRTTRREEQVTKVLNDLLHTAFTLSTGVFVLLPTYLVLEHMVIFWVAVAGIALVWWRFWLLLFAPVMAHHSTIVAFLVNAVLLFCHYAFEFILILETFLADVVNAIDDLFDIGVSIPSLGGDIDLHTPTTVSKHAVHDVLTDIAETCVSYDEAWGIIYHGIKQSVHESACATVRYLSPVPWVSDAADWVLRPFYDGSAAPSDSHDSPGNCINSLENDASISVLCSAIGSGFVIIEILLPFLLFAIVMVALASGVKRVLLLAGAVLHMVGEEVWWLAEDVVTRILL